MLSSIQSEQFDQSEQCDHYHGSVNLETSLSHYNDKIDIDHENAMKKMIQAVTEKERSQYLIEDDDEIPELELVDEKEQKSREKERKENIAKERAERSNYLNQCSSQHNDGMFDHVIVEWGSDEDINRDDSLNITKMSQAIPEKIEKEKKEGKVKITFMKKWSEKKGKMLSSKRIEPEIFTNKTFYKVMDNSMMHYGFQYSFNTLNELQGEFDPNPLNLGGGLYFCNLREIYKWFHLHSQGIVCEITLPGDATVFRQKDKYKTDRMYVKNPMRFEDFVIQHKLAEVTVLKKKLKYFSNPNEVIMEALNINGMNLQSVNQNVLTHEMRICAVKNNGLAIQYIKSVDLTYDIVATALKQNKKAMKYIETDTLVAYLLRDQDSGSMILPSQVITN